jgi:hypothetical protein
VSSGKSSLGAASKIGLRDGVLVFLGSEELGLHGNFVCLFGDTRV